MDQVHATTPAADENILLENIRQMNDIELYIGQCADTNAQFSVSMRPQIINIELFSIQILILMKYDNLFRPALLSFKKDEWAMHDCLLLYFCI